jgi:hypothetical protein
MARFLRKSDSCGFVYPKPKMFDLDFDSFAVCGCDKNVAWLKEKV